MDEEEGESYLADLNKAPDFIDEAPIEAPEVRHLWFLLANHRSLTLSTICS